MGTNRPLRVAGTWVFAFVIIMVCATAALAGNTYWQHDPATPGDWNDPLNWTAGVPSFSHNYYAYVCNTGTAQINGAAECASLQVGDNGIPGVVQQYAGTLQIGVTSGSITLHAGSRYELYGGTIAATGPGCSIYVAGGNNNVFSQMGGTCEIGNELRISSTGSAPENAGQYELIDGDLTTMIMTLSECRGYGEFIQTGGIATVTDTLKIGSYQPESFGYCNLADGQLIAGTVLVGDSGTGQFSQSGGTATFTDFQVKETGSCFMTGGSLEILSAALVKSTWDFGGGNGTVSIGANAFCNFGPATLLNTSGTSMTAGVDSITSFPSGFDPYTQLASYHSDGITHISGTPLTIPAGMVVETSGEFTDQVICYGTLRNTPGEALNLTNGVQVHTGGLVSLEHISNNNIVTVNDTTSGVFGGQLDVHQLFIGNRAAGHFVHDGGTNTTPYLILGQGPGGAGTYELRNGTLDVPYKLFAGGWWASGDSGDFIQSGGTANILLMTFLNGCSYHIKDGNLNTADIHMYGSDFVMSGGTVTIQKTLNPRREESGALFLDYGTADISGGTLDVAGLQVKSSAVTQSGGVVTVGQWGIELGYGAYSPTSYEISGSAELSTTLININGREGGGDLRQLGGVLTTDNMRVGETGGENDAGTYDLRDGTATIGEMEVGHGQSSGTVIQSGGNLGVGHIQINESGTYTLSGGSLTVADSVDSAAGFDFVGGNATMTAGGIVNFADGCSGAGSATFHLNADSLLIVPAGFDPQTDFGSFTSAGLVGQSGQDIIIPAGETVIGRGTIREHLQVAGAMTATADKAINIRGGLDLLTGGTAQLGTGSAIILNDHSGASGGQLLCENLQVGDDNADGLFSQSGGTMSVQKAFVGYGENGRGTYIMSDGNLTTDGSYLGVNSYGGVYAEGRFEQYGGTHATQELKVGFNSGNHGYYLLDGGELRTDMTYAGYDGNSLFVQTGGLHEVADTLWICGGTSHYDTGRYELHEGQLQTNRTKLYVYGETAEFVQTGGDHVTTNLENSGCYYMDGGTLTTPDFTLYAGGRMVQTGGEVNVETVRMADYFFGFTTNIYEISGGTLNVDNLSVQIGNSTCTARFIQSGGVVTATEGINIGAEGDGFYVLSGGLVTARDVRLGQYGYGQLCLESADAQVVITNSLKVETHGAISAVPGATIHMTGSAFENESTDSTALAGLKNLRLIFEGGTTDIDPFEVAGQDKGANWEAFHNNFTLGTLQLGGADVGQVQLVDNYDNQPGWVGVEAQYVKNLTLSAGSQLDLNGLNLYCLKFANNGGTIIYNGGTLTQIPPIDSINATYLDSGFVPTGGEYGIGELTVSDEADIVVESAAGQTTYDDGSVVMATSLFADNSAGGLASGLFRNGTLVFQDADGIALLIGDLIELELCEVFDGAGLLAGQGLFEVTGGSLEEAFYLPYGEFVQITFKINPADIDDFSGTFIGISNITLTPVPEPATLSLLAIGALALIRRRRK